MDEVRGLGRAIFAAVFLMIGGVLNIIYGIAAIGNSHFFTQNGHYVFASLKGWGWITLILGILEVLASVSLFGGGAAGAVHVPDVPSGTTDALPGRRGTADDRSTLWRSISNLKPRLCATATALRIICRLRPSAGRKTVLRRSGLS